MPAGRELPVPGTAAESSPTAAVLGTLAVPLVIVLGFRALAGRVDPPTWPFAPAHPDTTTPQLLVGAALAAAVLVAGWIRLRRSAEGGLRLRAGAITGPVVYGWYFAWGLFPAAVGSRPGERGALVAVSAVGFALTVPAMGPVPWPAQVALWLGAGLVWWLAGGRPLPARWRREPVPTA